MGMKGLLGRSMRFKRVFIAGIVVLSSLIAGSTARAKNEPSAPNPEQYRLRLYHLHTGERIDVVYRIGDQYLPEKVAELDHFLRDHRTNDVKDYDVKEFDLLHDLLVKLGQIGRASCRERV